MNHLIVSTFLLLNLLCYGTLQAQDWKHQSADEIFAVARQEAFAGNRIDARHKLNFILERSPEYYEVQIFLGKTYSWDSAYAEARQSFHAVLQKAPKNLEAIQALTDVELWSKNYTEALVWIERGLRIDAKNELLLYKKASVLYAQEKQDEALLALRTLLMLNPSHEKGINLQEQIRLANQNYIAGISYGVDKFSRTYAPAQYISAHIGRDNSWGSSLVRLNYADRFNLTGIQGEIDLYPKITKSMYAYINYGYSDSELFPHHRIGADVFSKLPASFETSAGIRYLDFNRDTKVTLYTGYLGWYFKNYWLSARSYITPDKQAGTAVSGDLSIRRYFNTVEHYLTLSGGLGFSPDIRKLQRGTGLSENEIYILRSQRFGASYQRVFSKTWIWNVTMDIARQELILDQGNYVIITSLSLGVRKKF